MSENRNPRARKHVLFAVKLAAVMIGAALLLALARKQGWIDHGLVVRAYNVVMGLALAVYFNVMPKVMHEAPPRSMREATLAQAVARVSGWTMTLAFLAWAALWAFAPQEIAKAGSLAAVGASVAVMLGYTVWKSVAGRRSTSG
ncbi:hypothetical protein FQY83_08755 [Luteimonas marina]|uniref:Ammonium transporter n=1 Tax=Luteimonas marina TaxID=488485 RepID=A0A5C5U7Q2_9GAMM|nr:hypothetical protein [Luteimonas marina]TWT21420.1 hypothetical protein FQY83_08755 [Luteimonas marina]